MQQSTYKLFLLLFIFSFFFACSNDSDKGLEAHSILSPLNKLLIGKWTWKIYTHSSDAVEFKDDYSFEGDFQKDANKSHYTGSYRFIKDSIIELIYNGATYGTTTQNIEERKIVSISETILIFSSSGETNMGYLRVKD